MFNFKKIFIFSIILFFIFIPKASAKYIFLGEVKFDFDVEIPEVDKIEISAPEADENGTTFTIQAKDSSGIQKIELYINNELFKSFEYQGDIITNQTEMINVSADDLPFYAECYAIKTNYNGEELKSNIIIPNLYKIYNLRDLVRFRDLQNNSIIDFENKDVYLMDDIDLSSIEDWSAIGTKDAPFKGIFHGNSHLINNMTIDAFGRIIGFFGQNNGVITNLNVSGYIEGYICENVGGIVGLNYGTVSYCNSKVTIFGDSETGGGVVGKSLGGTISHCKNYNSVAGTFNIGGICRT